MSTKEDSIPTAENQRPSISPGNYSPVTVYMEDSIGAVFLGILAVILLIGWRRSERRYHELMTQMELTDGSH